MERREFIAAAAMGTVAMSFTNLPELVRNARMGIVVHSYASRWNPKVESRKYPGFKDALELLEHCASIQAGGIQVGVKEWSLEFGKKMRDAGEKLGLYVEGSIQLPKNETELATFENEVLSAKEAGVRILRTVCLNGRRYENFSALAAFQEFKKNSITSLRLAEPIVRKHKMKLAVENHKDWRADELVSLIKLIGSEWVGITVDFGNSIALLEDPMEVVKTLAPFGFSTHVKDMGVEEYAQGFRLSEVPLGKGILDLPAMVALCRQHNPEMNFSLEMITRDPLDIPCFTDGYWPTFEGLPATELARTIRLVKKNAGSSLPRVSQLSIDDRLAEEEKNNVACLAYSSEKLNLK